MTDKFGDWLFLKNEDWTTWFGADTVRLAGLGLGLAEFGYVVYKRPFSEPQDAAETAWREQVYAEKRDAWLAEKNHLTQFNAELADTQEWAQEPNPVHSIADPAAGIFFGGQLVLAGIILSRIMRRKPAPN